MTAWLELPFARSLRCAMLNSFIHGIRSKRRDRSTLLSIIVLAALVILNVAIDPSFFTAFSLSTFFTDALPLLFMATGQFLVVMTGGIDLSVGSIVSVANAFVAIHMMNSSGSYVLVTVEAMAIGVLAGIINGAAVHWGRIQPILVTLATMSIYQGIALLILPTPGGAVPTAFVLALTGTVAGLPVALIVMIIMGLIWYWAHRTQFFLHIVSLGSDESAAQMNGVRVGSLKVGVYALSGLFSGLAGIYLAAQTSSGDPTVGAPLTLLSIAAVVIGGVRLSGGRGNVLGAFSGAIILSILDSIMYFLGVSSFYQDLFQGVVLLVAVALTSYRGIRSRRL